MDWPRVLAGLLSYRFFLVIVLLKFNKNRGCILVWNLYLMCYPYLTVMVQLLLVFIEQYPYQHTTQFGFFFALFVPWYA
jgi:hypothetical protein